MRNLLHAASLPEEALGTDRIINLPGITGTVAGIVASLGRVAGPDVAARVIFKEDPVARRIVSSWPARFDVTRALALGFSQDRDFEALIREFLEDEAAEKNIRAL